MEAAVDFSMWGLFTRATLTVQLVILVLIIASIWSWTVIINKSVAYRTARWAMSRFNKQFWSGQPLDEFFDTIKAKPRNGCEAIFVAGMIEWQRSHDEERGLIAGVQSRIERTMDVAIANESERLQKGLAVLATVGSTAPFIGLFGTVWGIMNAFIEISEQQNTSLAVVAPGIAEALLATGLGLLAAIPAVIFYNKFTADSSRLIGGYETFADEFSTILSRQLDDQ